MRKFCWILFLPLLLTACGDPAVKEPTLPENCRIVYRMESYKGERRTSHVVLTTARTAEGYYFDAGGGEEFLFLQEASDRFVMYIHSDMTGGFTAGEGVLTSAEKVEQFGTGVLHMGLLQRDVSALTATGETRWVAARSCLVYGGVQEAGEEYLLSSRVLVDQETGLTLGHWLVYTHRLTGEKTTYVMVCELFETEDVQLPQPV